MTPKEKAREKIDGLLQQCGWEVQDRSAINLSASRGVAIREGAMKTGEADYLLFADGKAIGTVEAKPEGHTLTGVEEQSGKYGRGLLDKLPHMGPPASVRLRGHRRGNPVYQRLDPSLKARTIFAFHRLSQRLYSVPYRETTTAAWRGGRRTACLPVHGSAPV